MPWKRILLCAGALATPFVLPWYVAFIIVGIAALYVPPVAIVAGLIYDFMYYTTGIPYFTVFGCVLAGVAYLVHRFIKTRIIS